MTGNKSTRGAGAALAREFDLYDALPPVVKKVFQNAPADFSVAWLAKYEPAKRARRRMTDDEYAAWLEEQFILTYRHNILPEAE